MAIGEAVTFGRYQQDNDTSNGKKPIRWIVLNEKDGWVRLLSGKVLDCMPYNARDRETTWETSEARAWLNRDFINAAFTPNERNALLAIEQKAGDNPRHGANGGRNVTDRVFLLSISEAEGMFGNDAARLARNTAYAKARGAQTGDGGTTGWRLLSIGASDGLAAFIDRDGPSACSANV